jgi:general secretion pathway protein H
MSPAGERGFTLLELLVVLVVIGLVLVATPRLIGGGTPALETRAAAREIAAALRRARSDAIRDNREVAVVVDTDAGAYTIGEAGAWRALPERVRLSVETAASELRDEDTAGVRFFPDGSASGGRITVMREGHSYHVMLDWLTGRVSIVE